MTFWKYARVSRRAPLIMLLFQLGFFAMGLLMVLIVNRFANEDPDYACLGTLFSCIGIAVGMLVQGNNTLSGRFSLAVAMGQTRRSFLLWDTVITALTGALGLLAAWGLYLLENALYQALYPGYENDIPMELFFRWQVLLPVLIGMCVLVLILGAFHQKFGMKVFTSAWLILCFGFMVIPRAIHRAVDGGTSLLARIGSGLLWLIRALSPAAWATVGVAIVLALLAFSVQVFRRAAVRL